MARTAIAVSTFLQDNTTSLPDPAGTAADQANGMNVALASGAMPGAPTAKNLVLRVANTAASPFTCIIRAGVVPPAFRQGLGDLTVTITNATTKWIGPLSSSRFAQTDGSINVDFGVGFTGTITAFLVPERVI